MLRWAIAYYGLLSARDIGKQLKRFLKAVQSWAKEDSVLTAAEGCWVSGLARPGLTQVCFCYLWTWEHTQV